MGKSKKQQPVIGQEKPHRKGAGMISVRTRKNDKNEKKEHESNRYVG